MLNLKKGNRQIKSFVTPEVFLSEGIDSTGHFLPAPFLPLLREAQNKDAWVVISRGTPVALASKKEADGSVTTYLVPAGYAKGFDGTYSRYDVDNGIKDAQGNDVTEGQAVMDAITAAGYQIGNFQGIASYDYFEHAGAGSNGELARKYKYANFNRQHTVAFNMDYMYELPMVKDKEEYAKAPLRGVAAFIGTEVLPGQFITYDKDSNFVVADAGFGYGGTEVTQILGQVSAVHVCFHPDTGAVIKTVNSGERVHNIKTSDDPRDQLAGVHTGGRDYKMLASNGYGLIRFGLQTR